MSFNLKGNNHEKTINETKPSRVHPKPCLRREPGPRKQHEASLRQPGHPVGHPVPRVRLAPRRMSVCPRMRRSRLRTRPTRRTRNSAPTPATPRIARLAPWRRLLGLAGGRHRVCGGCPFPRAWVTRTEYRFHRRCLCQRPLHLRGSPCGRASEKGPCGRQLPREKGRPAGTTRSEPYLVQVAVNKAAVEAAERTWQPPGSNARGLVAQRQPALETPTRHGGRQQPGRVIESQRRDAGSQESVSGESPGRFPAGRGTTSPTMRSQCGL